MIIANSRRFIFIHIHKCAGTSIEKALDPFMKWNDLVLGSTAFGMVVEAGYRKKFGLRKHSSAKEIREVVGPEIWAEYFTFSFVRHPFDRLVSLYRFCERIKGDMENGMRSKKGVGDWLTSAWRPQKGYPDCEPWIWPAMKALIESEDFSTWLRSAHLKGERGVIPQVEVLDGGATGTSMLDFVGKVENMERDWRIVCERIGIDVGLAHENPSGVEGASEWRKYFSADDVDYALALYAEDLERFEYSA